MRCFQRDIKTNQVKITKTITKLPLGVLNIEIIIIKLKNQIKITNRVANFLRSFERLNYITIAFKKSNEDHQKSYKTPKGFSRFKYYTQTIKKSNQVPLVWLQPLSEHMGAPMPPPPCTIVGTHIKFFK